MSGGVALWVSVYVSGFRAVRGVCCDCVSLFGPASSVWLAALGVCDRVFLVSGVPVSGSGCLECVSL